MAEQGAAQGARQVEPSPQVVRCLESHPVAVKLWAATFGIPVVDGDGVPVSTPDLARAVAAALVRMSSRPACANPNALTKAALLYVKAPPSAQQSRQLATGFYDATIQGTPVADDWRGLSNGSMAIFATIEAVNAGQESWAQI